MRQFYAGQPIKAAEALQPSSEDDYPEIENFDPEEQPEEPLREGLSPAARLAIAKENGEPHFKLGHKEIWLPDFPITFIQTPELDPRFAKFMVPLHMGKLDFRDFLWHGYQTRALNIRSWVYQRPVELSERTAAGKSRARWHRKKALKYMIVEMDEPFIWPVMPETTELFDPGLFKEMKKRSTMKDGKGGREKWLDGTEALKNTRDTLRKDAESILSGKVKWRPTHQVYARAKYS